MPHDHEPSAIHDTDNKEMPFFAFTSPGNLSAQARSHKGEVILVPFSEPELPLALNMVLNLRKLSFDHFLLLGLDEACCLHAAAVISDIGGRPIFHACTHDRDYGGNLYR